MVKRIQLTDEFYEGYDEDDDPYFMFFAPSYYDVDEQLVIVACLMLLEQRYRVLQSMSPQEIVEEIEYIIDSMYYELIETATNKTDSLLDTFLIGLLESYSIPSNYVNTDTSMYPIMEESINTLCNQLKGELKTKSLFHSDNLSKDTFNIIPNFKRAVQKVVDAVGSNIIWSKEKTSRNVDKFVYGEDKLYYWITANDDKVCDWCRMQESLPPRTLDEMPLDHPHGRCEREPVDYMYSNKYMLMLARGEYMPEIEAFTPDDEYMSQASRRRL